MLIENIHNTDANEATVSADNTGNVKFILHDVSNCILTFSYDVKLVVLKRKSSDPPKDKRKKIVLDNSDEKDYESSDTIDRFFSKPSTLGVSNIFSSDNYMSRSLSFTQVLHDPVSRQALPCILNSGENFTDVLTKIDLHPLSVEHDYIVKTFQN